MDIPKTPEEWIVCSRWLELAAPEAVYDWMRAYASGSSEWDGAPKGLFSILHRRGNPMVDLALARYADDPKVLRSLFERQDRPAQGDVSEESGSPIRVALFQNRATRVEDVLLGSWLSPEQAVDVLRGHPNAEVRALLTNQAVSPNFLEAVILNQPAKGEPLSAELWQLACACIGHNGIMTRDPSEDAVDGSDWYERGRPIRAIWELLRIAPLEERWADVLRLNIVPRVLPSYLSHEAAMEAIARWRSGEPALEKKFAALREEVAGRLSAGSALHPVLIAGDDLAARLGAYRRADLNSLDLVSAYHERDGKAFLEAVVFHRNASVLYRADVREGFRALLSHGSYWEDEFDWWFGAERKRHRELFARDDPDLPFDSEARAAEEAREQESRAAATAAAIERLDQRLAKIDRSVSEAWPALLFFGGSLLAVWLLYKAAAWAWEHFSPYLSP